jgi:hypothetical protein
MAPDTNAAATPSTCIPAPSLPAGLCLLYILERLDGWVLSEVQFRAAQCHTWSGGLGGIRVLGVLPSLRCTYDPFSRQNSFRACVCWASTSDHQDHVAVLTVC